MSNQNCFNEAGKYIPGGVNSPVRAFKSVGGTPIFMKSAKGAYITDVDNKTYVDYVGSWGPMILGHANDEVLSSVADVMQYGLSFGAPTELETVLAKHIVDRIKAVDLLRMCSSGTEATMSAIRIARGYTNRDLVIKFEGCYHGHSDCLLVKAGSGLLTLGVPTSLGVPADFAKHTLTLSYNDVAGLENAFSEFGDRIAAVIVEPIAGNMNLIVPHKNFLNSIRQLCTKYGSVFISDEVMTGFRVSYGGAAQLLDFEPDLVTFGKVIGGGMPVGAFGGKKEIMQCLAPLGGVYQAGTLSGNPVAMAAGIATLNATARTGFYEELAEKTTYFATELQKSAKDAGVPMLVKHVCGMFGIFFTDKSEVNSFSEVTQCDSAKFARFFHMMLEEGVYLAPSAYEAGFISIAHTHDDIDKTIESAKKVLMKL